MFAGPNGSGKSTLKAYLSPSLLGTYLNPDEIEQEMRVQRALDFSVRGVTANAVEIRNFFTRSSLLQAGGLVNEVKNLTFLDSRIEFNDVVVNSYFASVAVEFLRHELLKQKSSFTFETVMSHRAKIDFLLQAQRVGYRTYLYFIATDDPAINISRVRTRVKLGGHDVPEDKIVERYYRSLDLLFDAIHYTNRAYIFDNSIDSASGKESWLAEITDSNRLELKTSQIPAWFKRSVLDKITV